MTHLSVNVNKLATLRNSRAKNLPDVGLLAEKIITYGANGITVHPRPDGRHIRWPDVTLLHQLVVRWTSAAHPLEFNVEGYPSDDFVQRMNHLRPDQCTLVPDPPESLTSDAGWDLVRAEKTLRQVFEALRPSESRISLFIDPATFDAAQEQALARLRPHRIELYTEAYSDHFHLADRELFTAKYQRVAKIAEELGIGVNAGHDLNQQNLGHFVRKLPQLAEVSIGHALICEALEQGLETTVRNYLRILQTL